MAKNLILYGGSPLIGSPLVYQVTADTLTGTVSFHKVKIEVIAGMVVAADDELNKENSVDLIFSSPVNSGETIKVDISSALRAAADNYVYSSVPPSVYPHIKFSLKAWDEYMQNGEYHEKAGVVSNDGGNAIMGKFSDLERLLANGNKTALSFSRKPTDLNSAECVSEDETVVIPESFSAAKSIGDITTGPSSKVYSVKSASGSVTVVGDDFDLKVFAGRSFLVDKRASAKREHYQFRFVNSLGVLESASVLSLASQQMNLSSDRYDIAIQETFSSFSRGVYEKKNDYEKWKMCTGPIDKYWASWFLHEFLMASYVWVKEQNAEKEIWLPCHIVPEDTVQGVNRQDNSVINIEFTVELDINGSPLSEMCL